MKIRNTTTGQMDELIYPREPHNTSNLVDDTGIVYNEETDEREASQETIDWWTEHLKNESDYQNLYAEVRRGLDPGTHQDALDDELSNVISACEYGDAPIAFLQGFISPKKCIILSYQWGGYITALNERGEIGTGSEDEAIEYTEEEAKGIVDWLGKRDFSIERKTS